MAQSRKMSLIERACDLGSGMIVSYFFMQLVIAPFYHLRISDSENMHITLAFTAVSFVRGYLWRRVFNRL